WMHDPRLRNKLHSMLLFVAGSTFREPRMRLLYMPTEQGCAMARRYSRSASKDVERVMRKRKRGTLKSGRSGKKVKSRKQAIAIGLSEARREGKKVPRKSK